MTPKSCNSILAPMREIESLARLVEPDVVSEIIKRVDRIDIRFYHNYNLNEDKNAVVIAMMLRIMILMMIIVIT